MLIICTSNASVLRLKVFCLAYISFHWLEDKVLSVLISNCSKMCSFHFKQLKQGVCSLSIEQQSVVCFLLGFPLLRGGPNCLTHQNCSQCSPVSNMDLKNTVVMCKNSLMLCVYRVILLGREVWEMPVCGIVCWIKPTNSVSVVIGRLELQ